MALFFQIWGLELLDLLLEKGVDLMQWGTKKDAKRNLGELSCFLCSLINMISFCAMRQELNLEKRIREGQKKIDTHNLHSTFFLAFEVAIFCFLGLRCGSMTLHILPPKEGIPSAYPCTLQQQTRIWKIILSSSWQRRIHRLGVACLRSPRAVFRVAFENLWWENRS